MSAAVELARLSGELEQRKREIAAAKEADAALRWFEQYGSAAIDDNAPSFEVGLSFASKCVGSNEAIGYLERACAAMVRDIIDHATTAAKADLSRVLP